MLYLGTLSFLEDTLSSEMIGAGNSMKRKTGPVTGMSALGCPDLKGSDVSLTVLTWGWSSHRNYLIL